MTLQHHHVSSYDCASRCRSSLWSVGPGQPSSTRHQPAPHQPAPRSAAAACTWCCDAPSTSAAIQQPNNFRARTATRACLSSSASARSHARSGASSPSGGGAASAAFSSCGGGVGSRWRLLTPWRLLPPSAPSSPVATLATAAAGAASSAASPSPAAAGEVESLGMLKRRVSEAESRLAAVLEVADVAGCRAKLASLEHDASGDGLWGDSERAQKLMAEIGALRSEVQELDRFLGLLEECAFAVELLEAEASPGSASSSSGGGGGGEADSSSGHGGGQGGEQGLILGEAATALHQLNQGLEGWELRRLLSGPYDDRGARVVISAGAGGVDAMDWAELLERMYIRWAEAGGYSVRVLDRAAGEEAGLKSVELEVTGGRYAYGYLRGEKGTHRLVRNSPFNAKGLRQTSFAGVDVMPVLGPGDLPDLDLNERDLEFSTMRSGGKGGQNVNKVETGVRVLHVPTGLSVKCTQERSQAQNREIALDILKARLLVVLEEQNARRVAEIRGDLVKAEWGQQIRNYVFHPYKLVKDTRTGQETSDVGAVLDGELGALMAAYLRLKGRQAVGASLAAEGHPAAAAAAAGGGGSGSASG